MDKDWRLRTAFICICSGPAIPLGCLAEIKDDSHLSINFRNFYLSRNFTDNLPTADKIGNWSQGFDLQYESGYSETPVAVGLDINGQFALRLDSSGNDGTLPYSLDEQKAARDYGRAGATLKFKYARTSVKIGDQKPNYPVASNDPSRLLDTIYQGAVIESRDLDRLTLVGGRFWSIVTRQSSDHERLYRWGTADSQHSDGLDFAGATYALTPALQASYFHGVLNDIYKQDYGGIKHAWPIADGYVLRTDLGYFNNREDGSALGGAVDNRAYSGLITLEKGGHLFGASYQRMAGETVFPTLNGYVPQLYLPNWAGLPFIRPDERSWSVRYGYNFAAMGLPGLRMFTRYIKGTDIDRGKGLSREEENERDISFNYVVQSGPFKDLLFEVKNFRIQQKFGNDYNEYRLVTSYTWKIW
ncbi:OprD family outer membrane porin [Pseudomonas sp. S2_B10]|jgi:hypothetical protein